MKENNNTINEGIDERLMAAQKAGELREEKKKAGEEGGVETSNQYRNQEPEEQGDLRQSKLAALKEKANIKKKLKEKVNESVINPAKMATANGLRWAWLTLIPSWGLSIIYINMHVFLRFVLPDLFCKLGEEWIPKQVKALTGEGSDGVEKGIGILEIIALVAIDLILLFFIILVVAFLVILADIIANPIETAWSFAWDWVGNVFKSLLN
jgi:hypothetical protein